MTRARAAWTSTLPAASSAAPSAPAAEASGLLDRLARGECSEADQGELLAGVRAWAEAGRPARLERFLGLPCEPGQPWRAMGRRAERNRWLLEASNCLPPSMSDWERAHELAKQIGMFKEQEWRAWSDLDEPPKLTTRLRCALFHAFKEGKVPEHWRQLRYLVQTATASFGTENT